MTSSLPLSTLFTRALECTSKAYNLPTKDESTQELLTSSLNDLKLLESRISDLSIFSPNEVLDDISTKDLIYLLVPYVLAQVEERIASEPKERPNLILQSQRHIRKFVSDLENYEIITESDRKLHSKKATSVADASQRRQLKIQQYKAEKDLRARIEVIRKRRRQSPSEESESDFQLIAALLPSSTSTTNVDEDDDDESEDPLREATLLLLRLMYTQAQSQLESMDQELELLRGALAGGHLDTSVEDPNKGKQADEMWKLDKPNKADGPLLDPSGKPLRPFTILPSGAADRARLQSKVFGPGHNLPTMSIDEYLRIEQERGNILTGGGAASAAAPTSKEQLEMDSEMDGTWEGEQKAEEKRQKDENWARFTDENPKGAGNTMNRG